MISDLETTALELKTEILGEPIRSTAVVRYADLLVTNGYNMRSMLALTMSNMDAAMSHCQMTDGHRCLFEADVARRTPWLERGFMTFIRSMERCASVVRCLKTTIPEDAKTLALASMMKDDTGNNDDDEETAGD